MKNEWVYLPKYGQKYRLYNDGTVVSTRTGKKMYTQNNAYGYPRVLLWSGGEAKRVFVHRLVATYFVDNPNNLPVVRHKDDDRTNCHYTNLEWGTQQDNVQDTISRQRGFIGEKNGRSKLTEGDLHLINAAFSTGLQVRKIAEYHNVSTSTIYRIKKGLSWKHCKK